ncbi:MAG: zinc-binding alcohol dehydrogenase family protein [Candidatus Hydrogenedentales bacterium]|jgi:NADPH:quinone reductase-like Zn-dependent oxidoreductase
MRAWRFHKTGDIKNLVLEEAALPEPKEDEVILGLKCIALNPADRYLIQGQYPRAGTPPFIPGRDGAGVVLKGSAKGRFQQGDNVCILGGLTGVSTPGTLAEKCVVPEKWLAPIPEGWSFEQAAAAPLVHLTAWRALKVCGNLKADETVVITGASGGVGTAALFLAKAAGATVIALSRDKQKWKTLEALGADHIVDSNVPALDREIREKAGGAPVSLILDTLGGMFTEKCLRTVAAHGRIIVVGLLADLKTELTLGLLIHKNVTIQGMSVSAFSAEEAQQAWENVLACYENSSKRPLISHIFQFDEVQEAFQHLKEGPLGKVVIRVP